MSSRKSPAALTHLARRLSQQTPSHFFVALRHFVSWRGATFVALFDSPGWIDVSVTLACVLL
ncbi:MAG: hypothetical protein SF182_24755 [Deltaproteobacteria bacterium]|nr:hypothetical protein [Deltaproteobacteria bacterium]